MDDTALFGFTTLTATPASPTTATAFNVGDTSEWPTAPFNLIVHRANQIPRGAIAESIRVTAYNSSGVTTCTRAQESTSALSLQAGDWAYPSVNKILTDIITGYLPLTGGDMTGGIDQTFSHTPSASDKTGSHWVVTSTPAATEGAVRNFTVTLYSNPTANVAANDASAIMAFVEHQSGNFTQILLRAIGGTVTQSAAGTIGETRGVASATFVNTGTITLGIGYDSNWNIPGGAMTTYVHFRGRVGASGAPGTEQGIITTGYNQLTGNTTIGAFANTANVSLTIASQFTTAAGTNAALSIAHVMTVDANSRDLYCINTGPTIAKGAFTGLRYFGIALINPSVSGAGTIDSAAMIYMDLPTIATNNHYFNFASALSAAPAGAVQGGIKVQSPSGVGYIAVQALS